ncbi:MAG: hypothetical protein ACKVWR_04435, partial [Acidimicrobiales bacterium]
PRAHARLGGEEEVAVRVMTASGADALAVAHAVQVGQVTLLRAGADADPLPETYQLSRPVAPKAP